MDDILKTRLHTKLLIFDGAMGTEIYKRKFFVNTSYDNLCLSAPKIVQEIHQQYKDAGAEVLTTNSYGAHSWKLQKFGLADKTEEICRASVQIARKVAGRALLVAGSIGPIGEAPADKESLDDAADCLAQPMRVLAEEGVDFLLFETVSTRLDADRIMTALKKNAPSVPYAVSFVVSDPDRCTMEDGTEIEALWHEFELLDVKPSAFGLNCGIGPDQMLFAVEKLVHKTELPLIVQPNSGTPKKVDGRMLTMCSPEYFTTYALRYASLGVKGIGGCCGTTPDDIRDMARSLNPLVKAQTNRQIFASEPEPAVMQEEVPFAQRSTFAEKLARKAWICNIEVVPPQGYCLEKTIEKAKLCREYGFDCINIPDGPRASSRVSPLVTAIRIQSEAGIETILHQCCRDKNLIGMQSELLGCAAMNVNNILFITGDPPKLGDYPFASGVFDVDSIGMIKLQKRLNRGIDLGGKAIDQVTRAVIGAGADPNAIDFDREVRRTREKIASGAEYIVTQPVFDVSALLRFMDAVPELSTVPLIAGIWPFASLRNAEFMRSEVPGVVVPDAVMARMAAAATKEEQRAAGIAIAREAIEAIRGRVAGVQVSAPFGNVVTAAEVIKGFGGKND